MTKRHRKRRDAGPATGRLGKSPGKSPAPFPEKATEGRDAATGRFLPANKAARKHGLYEYRHHHVLPPNLKAAVEAFAAQLMTEQGGESECSALRLGLMRRITEVEAICRLLADDLATHGPLTTKGRMRSSTGAFLSAVDRFNKLAAQLGLERRQKKVPSLDEFIAQQMEP